MYIYICIFPFLFLSISLNIYVYICIFTYKSHSSVVHSAGIPTTSPRRKYAAVIEKTKNESNTSRKQRYRRNRR